MSSIIRAWARVLTARVAPIARVLEPRIYAWPRVEQPYAGGDPINYLRFGREMQSFYQAHVREPVFPATVRLFLVLLQDQDIALSFASVAMSTLAIFGTFVLGRRAFGAPVGLLAALGWAIDYDAVSWAPDGWRDDTFTCILVFATWSLVRLLQNPRRRQRGARRRRRGGRVSDTDHRRCRSWSPRSSCPSCKETIADDDCGSRRSRPA